MPRQQTAREQLTYAAYTWPAVLLYGFFFILPLFVGIYYSMTDWNGISQSFNFTGLYNYVNLFRDHRIVNSISFSLRYSLFLVIVVNSLALVTAVVLNADMRGQRFFRAVYFFPAIISLVVVGLIFDQIFYHVIPRIGTMLNLGFLESNLLGNPDSAFWIVLLVSIWRETAIPTVLILAGLQTVPQELIEAAVIDGAGPFTRFTRIVFPFLIPVFSMTLVLTVKSGIMAFDIIKAMTGGGPGIATESIGLLIYKKGFEDMQFGYASALSFFLFFLVAVISYVQIILLKKKEVGQL